LEADQHRLSSSCSEFALWLIRRPISCPPRRNRHRL
jgi:hypothetical protein